MKIKVIDEATIYDILKDLGIPANFKGYKYIKDSIWIISNNRTTKMGELYKDIADKYSTTPAAVERGIRHSIEYIFNSTELPDIIKNIFGKLDRKPRNGEFLFTIVEYLNTH